MPLSAAQHKYLAVAFACMESEPKIDYERFKELCGLASAHSARELLRVTKKKLFEEYGIATATTAKQSTPLKKATSAANAEKTSATKKRKVAKEIKEEPSADDDEHSFDVYTE